MSKTLIVGILTLTLAVMSCGKKNEEPAKDTRKANDVKGNNDPVVDRPPVTPNAPITKWLENVDGSDPDYGDIPRGRTWVQFSIVGDSACYQLVEREGIKYLQISSRRYSDDAVPVPAPCPASLIEQSKVFAEFRFTDGRISTTYDLKTSFGNTVGKIYDKADGTGRKMVDLCTDGFSRVCRLVGGSPTSRSQFVLSKIEPVD